MAFQNGDPIGGVVPPSTIGYELGESLGAIPKSGLKFRQYYQQNQPTIANSSGMHSLPPVYTRIPISDQYAIGIAHPDTSLTVPDPTLYKRVNGNVSLGQTAEDRQAQNASVRSRMQQIRRTKNTLQG